MQKVSHIQPLPPPLHCSMLSNKDIAPAHSRCHSLCLGKSPQLLTQASQSTVLQKVFPASLHMTSLVSVLLLNSMSASPGQLPPCIGSLGLQCLLLTRYQTFGVYTLPFQLGIPMAFLSHFACFGNEWHSSEPILRSINLCLSNKNKRQKGKNVTLSDLIFNWTMEF